MYAIRFTRSAYKALLKTPNNVVQRIRERLDEIAADPYASHPYVVKLREREGYRLRVGDWRVIYEICEDEVVILVLRIGPRGGVYR